MLEIHTRKQYYVLILITSLTFILVGIVAFLAIQYPVDDAFIVFRYVDRFLEGKGLTFNNGEYVEGFTSLSWTLLLALLGSTGLRPNIASLLMNYILSLLTGLAMYWLLLIIRVDWVYRIVALFFLGISLLFFKVVFLGLELGMFIWLLMLFLCALLISVHFPYLDGTSRFASVCSGLLAAVLFATRPESALLLPLLLLTFYMFFRKRNEVIGIQIRWSITSFFVLFLPIFVWRLLYYGAILPNSITAKSISLLPLRTSNLEWLKDLLIDSAKYFYEAYITNPLFIFTALLSAILIIKGGQVFVLMFLLVPIVWQHIIILANGGDWMPFYRFINMYTPLIIVCFVVVLREITQRSRLIGLLFILAMSGLYLYTNFQYLDMGGNQFHKALGSSLNDNWYEGDLYRWIGESLNDVWIEDDILIPEAIGNISYFGPSLYIHDPTGLTDKKLATDETAQRSVYGRTNWHYSMELRPAIVLLHWWPQELELEDLRDYNHYCVGPLPKTTNGASLYLLMRRDRVINYERAMTHLGLEKISYAELKVIEGPATQWCKQFLDIE